MADLSKNVAVCLLIALTSCLGIFVYYTQSFDNEYQCQYHNINDPVDGCFVVLKELNRSCFFHRLCPNTTSCFIRDAFCMDCLGVLGTKQECEVEIEQPFTIQAQLVLYSLLGILILLFCYMHYTSPSESASVTTEKTLKLNTPATTNQLTITISMADPDCNK